MNEQITRLLVIQPTPFCNIDCTYCYLPDRKVAHRMDRRTLERIATAVFSADSLDNDITIVWHAGEPLVLPIAFYEAAIEIFERANVHGIKVRHSIQTNGTLITEDWCNFFLKRNIEVGVSIDGPAELHDAARVDRSGRGTFERTMKGISILQQHGIEFGIIAVLTEESLNHPDEIWDFFIGHNITQLAFNLQEKEAASHRGVTGDKVRTAEKFSDFLSHILTRWLNHPDRARISVREITQISNLIVRKQRDITCSENVPLAILNFDWQGNFSTYSPELLGMRDQAFGDFIFGNVFKDELRSLLSNDKFLRMNELVQSGVEQCRSSCAYFELCGGGPPVNKLCENGSFASTETEYCAARIQAATNVVLGFLERKLLLA